MATRDRERERVGPDWGPCFDTGVSSQSMTNFSFHVEALEYIFVFLGIAPPPTVATGTSDRLYSLSLSLAAMGSPAPSYLLNNISWKSLLSLKYTVPQNQPIISFILIFNDFSTTGNGRQAPHLPYSFK